MSELGMMCSKAVLTNEKVRYEVLSLKKVKTNFYFLQVFLMEEYI